MNQKDLYLLLYLAQKTASEKPLKTSTGKIAAELGLSQQTVSRKLTDFVGAGMIQRIVTPSGVEIRISSDGRKHLHALYNDLQQLFLITCTLHGTVQNGLGEGKFYMSQERYKKQFQNILGFIPYPGTLNLGVDSHEAELFLASKEQHYISGFKTKERTFGGLKCYPVRITGRILGAIILPDRNVHRQDTVEIIAPVFLRETLLVENGHDIHVE